MNLQIQWQNTLVLVSLYILTITGLKCQNIDDCHSNLCLNGGTCFDKENDFECKCQEDWVGKTCEGYDYCRSKPCKNRGSCTNEPEMSTFKCLCQGAFEGLTCTESCK